MRLDGIPVLDLWDLIVSVLGNTTQNHYRTARPVVCSNERHKRKQSRRVINDSDNVDFISSNVNSSRQEALLYVFEDSEAVIKMIIKGRSPTMRHVSRTQRVALDWLFDRINLDPKSQIKYIDTKNQLADLTLAISVLPIVLKRWQKEYNKIQVKKRVTAKSIPMMNLIARSSERAPSALSSTASERVKTQIRKSNSSESAS